jgi:hypothetical protein
MAASFSLCCGLLSPLNDSMAVASQCSSNEQHFCANGYLTLPSIFRFGFGSHFSFSQRRCGEFSRSFS